MDINSDLKELSNISTITPALHPTPGGNTIGVNGSVSLPKAPGTGVLIEDGYGWQDLIGQINPLRSGGTGNPTLQSFIGEVLAYSHGVGDSSDCMYHIPHDYAPGTDLFLHVHWSHNGTNISGTLSGNMTVTYAKGHSQAAFSTPVIMPITVPNLTIANTPQYSHVISEGQLSAAVPTASQIDSSLIEPDGLVLIHYSVTSIPTITGGTSSEPFVFTLDIHYQTTNMPTKNKSPNFWV